MIHHSIELPGHSRDVAIGRGASARLTDLAGWAIVGLLAARLIGTPAPLAAQVCQGAEADSMAVLRTAEGIIQADNDRDLERVLRHYAEDAVLMPPSERPVRGHPAIRPRYEALFDAYDPAIVMELQDITVCGDLAVVSGRNGGRLVGRGDAEDRELSDAFVMILRRRGGGTWVITRLMWHTDGNE